MPTFSTPSPILAVIEFAAGDTRISASDRADTVVEVRPSDAGNERDVRTAEQTRVEYAGGRLLVKGPQLRNLFGKPGSIEVTVDLPAGSSLQGNQGMGAVRTDGQLGDCRLHTGLGDVVFDETGALDVSTGAGSITADRVNGRVDLSTGTGRVRLRDVQGGAAIKNSNGDTWIGEVGGDLRIKASNGSIQVDRARAGVEATTANGDVRVGGLTRGLASLKTATGALEIGVQDGAAARLDLHTQFGKVHNEMDAAGQPTPGDEFVEVHARTSMGDITIRRTP
jgi:DUF4097 and DUF4098 domain-containing protein YvlB